MEVGVGLHSVWVTTLVAVVGCGAPDAAPDAGLQVTDSAGISVVTTAPVDGLYARLAEEPALVVGEPGGAEEQLLGRSTSRFTGTGDGLHLGHVEVDTSFRIREVGRGQVVGVATDELGVGARRGARP